MENETSIFQIFGGVRPMARMLGERATNVAAWKRVGRIPAEKQPHVLATAKSLNLPVTATNIIFPLGTVKVPSTAEGCPSIGNAAPLTEAPEAGQ